jgi:rhodanese-related sulfurtransferase
MIAALFRLFGKKPLEPRWLDAAGLRARLADAAAPLVLDVRGPDEFDGPLGHIDGAVNIPLSDLPARLAEVTGDQPVVCVCLTDKRSAAAAAQLADAGVGEVGVLRGGMKAWREAGL